MGGGQACSFQHAHIAHARVNDGYLDVHDELNGHTHAGHLPLVQHESAMNNAGV